MTDVRVGPLLQRVAELEAMVTALHKGFDVMAPGLVDLRRDEHESHRILLALAAVYVQNSPDPLATVDVMRRLAFQGMEPDQTEDTRERIEKVLASLEQGAIAAGQASRR